VNAAIAALTLAALALRWPTLAGPSFWVDEWVTRQIVSRPLLDVLRAVKEMESTPPLYYVLAWAWAHLFGSSEFALRFLSGLFGAATVPVAYAAGTVLASRRAGLIAASLVAVNPLLVWYSTEARAYSLLVLLGATTFLFFARALVAPKRRTLALWSLTGVLALAVHYFAAFLVGAEALVLFAVLRSQRDRVWLALVPMAATGLALLPLAHRQGHNAGWIVDVRFTDRLAQLPRNFAVGVSEPRTLFTVAVAVLVVVALLLLLARAGRQDRRAAAIALAVGVLALALPLLTATVRDYVLTRNLIAALFPLALAVAVACAARRAGAAGLLVAAGLCAVWLAVVVAIASDSRLQRADWKQAAALIGQPDQDRLVLAWSDWGASPLGDELAGARRLARGDAARVAEVALLGSTRPSGNSCWSGSACNIGDVHPRTDISLARFSFARGRKDGMFEVLRFRAARPVRLTWDNVSKVEPRYGAPAIWLQRSTGGGT
jgi:4-amino-4-deoxy-L-arabinose transferase-like glycosyltransferase